jgi:two-component system, chemotaxis family, response regulator PixH
VGRERTATIESVNHSSQPFKILVVDDSAISRRLVKHSLSGERYEVLFAKDGREALDLFVEHRPAVVITDWSMPDIGGLELCDGSVRTSKTALLTSSC